MSPRVRAATTGVPPRSRRKAAHGTSATAILVSPGPVTLALWTKAEGAIEGGIRAWVVPLGGVAAGESSRERRAAHGG